MYLSRRHGFSLSASNGTFKYMYTKCTNYFREIPYNLSPSLYGKLIDDLIKQCIKEKIGALLHNTNTCILVYADDILLISPNDY